MNKKYVIFLFLSTFFIILMMSSGIASNEDNDNFPTNNKIHINTKEIIANQFDDNIWEEMYVREYPDGDFVWDLYVDIGTEVQFDIQIQSELILGHDFVFSVVQLPLINNEPMFDYVEGSAWWPLTYLLGASDTEVLWCFPHVGFLIVKTMRFNAIVNKPGSPNVDLTIFSLIPDTTEDPSYDHVRVIGLNDPPNQPTSPSGPSTGYRNQSLTYSTQTSDPEGDNIRYLFDWGDGSTDWTNFVSSNVPVSMAHEWTNLGSFQIKVKAQDIYGYDSAWSQIKTLTIINRIPSTPTLGPPSNGHVFNIFPGQINVDLTASSLDLDGDNIRYRFWDADTGTIIHTTDWLPYHTSGTVTWQHLSPGTYHWYSKTQDILNDWSSQSVTYSFIIQEMQVPPYPPSEPIPKNGSININIHTSLFWLGGDPNSNDTVTYDVYFGTTNPPPKVSTNQSNTIYIPGLLMFNQTYYWKIVSWDNHNASTTGRAWHFVTAENNAPNQPSNPNPTNNTIDVDVNINLSWVCIDPDGNTLTYDVYLEENDSTPDVLVSENQIETMYNPELFYNTKYYWQIIAKDELGATTAGPIWNFITESVPKADLSCEGDLSWIDVTPGSTVTGIFTVENIGKPSTLLNWEIIQWPTWGSWAFDPQYGVNLSSEDPLVIVHVTVQSPTNPETQFNGNIKIINTENSSDFCTIDVSLSTPANQEIINLLMMKKIHFQNSMFMIQIQKLN